MENNIKDFRENTEEKVKTILNHSDDIAVNEDNAKFSSYNIGKMVMENLEDIDITKHETDLISKINQVILNDIDSNYFILMAPKMKYVTMFYNKNNRTKKDFSKEIYNFLKEEVNNGFLGKLKDYGLRDKGKALELWLGTECYLLFSYKLGVVEV